MRKMMMMVVCLLICAGITCQGQVQTIRGTVTDEASNAPIAYATIIVLNTNPLAGASTDSTGNYTIPGIVPGRYSVQASFTGYETRTINEVEVKAGKETLLSITLKEESTNLKEVVIKYKADKGQPMNRMATASARMLSVEEAKRYAGGFDDPARLASSFAGVASNVGNNGIVVRGNAPQYLQWKMEGVEIPNPNHFADLSVFGGGGLTAMSSNLLSNSDFFTGAFPAEYSNALSGVFDIFMRNGNDTRNEHSVQVGLIGIDAASEGPFSKNSKASYLFNYRYSTLALLGPLLPENGDGVRYQDLSFKLNFPTKHAGTFSLWGIGLADRSGAKAKDDSTEWTYSSDKEQQEVKQYMGAAGLTHKYFLNRNIYIKTILAATITGIDQRTDILDNSRQLQPENKIGNTNRDYTLSSCINTKFNQRHTNRTGISARIMDYSLALAQARASTMPMQQIVDASGSSALFTAYTCSSYGLTDKLSLNAGVNGQLFALNGHYTIEPRAGLKWQMNKDQSLAVAYGLHSRIERLNFYFNKQLTTGQDAVNKNMDLSKAHHLVLSYDWRISDILHLKAETYYQQLFDVPVIADSSFSFINMQNDWFFADKLVNTGKGRNYGIDLTFEQYISQGFYYMVTASVFDSKYAGGDGMWRNTRYNRSYLLNCLAGKEWKIKQNTVGINVRTTLQGGDRYTPVDIAASQMMQDVVYNETNAFSKQLPATFTTHLTASYRINRKHVGHELALKIINLTGQPDFYGYQYNYIYNTVDKHKETILIPNLSYRIDF